MSIALSTISPSSTCWTRDEQVAHAFAVIADARTLRTIRLGRTERKVLNQALFIVGLPTLGAAHTYAQYEAANM